MQAMFNATNDLSSSFVTYLDAFECAVRERLSPFAAQITQRLFDSEAHNHPVMIELERRARIAAFVAVRDGLNGDIGETAIGAAAEAIEKLLVAQSNVIPLRRRD